jgi:FkbM family methyltransferase
MKMRDKVFRKIEGRFRRLLNLWKLRGLLDADGLELTKIGSAYGGWIVPKSKVKSGTTAVCVGAGEDISFDVELNKKGVHVFTLDPTPRAQKHVAQVLAAASGGPAAPINNSRSDFYDLRGFDQERFTFKDVGIWNENASMRFFAPEDPSHVSHSVVNLQHTDQYFEAKCVRLQTVCDSFNIRDIEILKLDIEGAEYNVLKDMLDCKILPSVLCIEIDELRNPLDDEYMPRVVSAIQMLKKNGYKFRHITNCNALFVR